MESDLGISTVQYAMMNSLFFGPNIISPILAGVAIKRFGNPALCFLVVSLMAGCGHLLFALGSQYSYLPLLFFGRLIAGIMYEIIDTFPVILLRPLFQHDSWSTVIGLVQSSLRLGSVFCFVLSPVVYKHSGVRAALWLAALVALVGCVCSGFVHHSYPQDCATAAVVGATPVSSSDGDTGYIDSKDSLKRDQMEVSQLDQKSHGGCVDEDSQSEAEIEEGDGLELTRFGGRESSSQPHSTVSGGNDSGRMINNRGGDAEGVCGSLFRAFPLLDLSTQLYLYVLAAACVYGALVPFWFSGSKLLQNTYGLDVRAADSLVLIPEALMVVISPILGIVMDRYKADSKTRLRQLAGVSLVIPLAYLLIIKGYYVDAVTAKVVMLIPPWMSLVLLGFGFSFSHGLIWFTITEMFPAMHFEFCSGMLCSAINLLPAVIPPFVAFLDINIGPGDGQSEGHITVWVLICVGLAGSVSAAAASMYPSLGSSDGSRPVVTGSASGDYSQLPVLDGDEGTMIMTETETSREWVIA